MTLPMREFLEAVEAHRTRAFEALTAAGHHPNVIVAKAEKASRKGYIDYGVVVTRPWLTDKGRAFLERSHG